MHKSVRVSTKEVESVLDLSNCHLKNCRGGKSLKSDHMCSVGGKPSFVGTINVFIYTSTSDINNEYSLLRVYVYV